MNELIKFLNKNTNEKYLHLRFKNAIFSVEKNSLDIQLYYRENCAMTNEQKVEIEQLTNTYLDNKFKVNISYYKNYLDETFLLKDIKQLLQNKYQSLAVMLNADETKCFYDLDNSLFTVDFYVYLNFYDLPNLINMTKDLKDEFIENYCYNFEFNILKDENFDFNQILTEQSDDEIIEIDGKKQVSKKYTTVFPQPFIDIKQMDLFTVENKISNENLLNNTFVVFDLETTGLNAMNDKIIEIGAVKIEKGKITQQFSTLINPLMSIPPDATRINGITDKMVTDAPIFNRVIADFYKFCFNCTLVAHNATFDMSFLNYASTPLGYLFNNPQQDTLLIARTKIKGLKNYRLATICEKLGVVLNNAHRSIGDASATAKIFIKLLENY